MKMEKHNLKVAYDSVAQDAQSQYKRCLGHVSMIASLPYDQSRTLL